MERVRFVETTPKDSRGGVIVRGSFDSNILLLSPSQFKGVQFRVFGVFGGGDLGGLGSRVSGVWGSGFRVKLRFMIHGQLCWDNHGLGTET